MSTKILISPIKTEEDYENALIRIEEIFDSEINTPEFDELDILTTLVQKYEEKHYPILPPSPVDAIKFKMEEMGITQTELAKIIGANRISEILNNKRKLSLNIIKKLHDKLKIPLEILLE
ncbi:MAG: helix-turn-helix domain-containing protein [Candidatus Sericytochromatia bacterium]